MYGAIGLPGVLAKWVYKSTQSTKTERPVSFKRTLGGKSKGLVARRGRREWEVSFDLIGSTDVEGLANLAESLTEPVAWYPADAVAGNLLSPQAASFSDTSSVITDLGFASLPSGLIARAVAPAPGAGINIGSAHGNSEWVMVSPGERMSFGVFAYGGGRVGGTWRDRDGLSVGTFLGPSRSFTGWEWVESSFTPPSGAVYASVTLSAGSRFAAPSASWGGAASRRPGRGCPKALVHGLSESLETILSDDSYGGLSVTITEVG